jgi:hypothetical protein
MCLGDRRGLTTGFSVRRCAPPLNRSVMRPDLPDGRNVSPEALRQPQTADRSHALQLLPRVLAALFTLMVSWGLPGCRDECPIESCLPNMEYGISLTVTDATTGANAACGATAWLTDRAYADTMQAWGCSFPESLHAGAFVGARERPGTYEVHVEKPGYQPWQRSDVVVVRRECSCHVSTVGLEARLQPL